MKPGAGGAAEAVYVVTLAGNPNTGKSTLFNALTGLKQHTGNWTGKTVGCFSGEFSYKNARFIVTDLPGTYTLDAASADELAAQEEILRHCCNATVVVADATCIERNLILALQLLEIKENVILCLNLIDEAERKSIKIDTELLSKLLHCPVALTNAVNKRGMAELYDAIYKTSKCEMSSEKLIFHQNGASHMENLINLAREITAETVVYEDTDCDRRDRAIDNAMLSRRFGIPIMLLALFGVFWLTVVGANYPSGLLAKLFGIIENALYNFLHLVNSPEWLIEMLITGIYRTLAWVISVMLPPMAIFFPLFTVLEDSGFLPRVAFNLDYYFCKCGSHGKQALTMCMGVGCNAAGVTACKIIDSERERLIAILTNSFMPCNGRFPTLILLAAIIASGIGGSALSALIVFGCVILAVCITFLVSKILSKTMLKGMPSGFILELPPYRKPRFLAVILRSITEKTLVILGRAVTVALPAGLLIWVLNSLTINGTSVILYISTFLNPFAVMLGIDGMILTAFIIGLPANEIVMPIALMCYTGASGLVSANNISAVSQILAENGWNVITALCVMIFSLCHFPCATTLLTIKKETRSLKWTFTAFLLPTAVGILLCFIIAQTARLLTG